jgi:hypothetical protein
LKHSFAVRLLVVAVLLVVMISTFGTAQTTKGTIAGVVSDKTGAVIPGATVTAASTETGDTRTAVTGSNGEYRLETLTPGVYVVTVSASGFGKTKVEGVVVRTSILTSNNIVLVIGTTAAEVTVEASADTIQTESGELSKTISATAIQNMPYSTQNPYTLAVTLPGVSTVSSRDTMTNGTGFSVNGLRPRSNNFLIDGFDNNDNGIAGQAFQPNNTESVQEVTVLTNSYAAEFGRGGGSVSNLSFRSGGNTFHGAGWEQYSGAGLDALQSLDARNGLTRVPQYVNNIFGFRLGGPIKKDKLYFFGTSQWNRFFGDPGASQLVVPTAAGFDVLKNLATAGNANAKLMVDALGNVRSTNPQGTVEIGNRAGCPACEVEYGYFRRTDKGKSISREWTGRVDYNSSNDNLYVRYTDSRNDSNPDLFANSGALPSQDTQQGGPSRLLGVMWAHTFNPKLINEFRASAQQLDFTFAPTDATAASASANLPTMWLVNSDFSFFWGGYAQSTFPHGRGHKTFQFQDSVSWSAGRHTMKLGADLAVLLIQDKVPFNWSGTINYGAGGDCSSIGLATCTDLANYLDNYAGGEGSYSKSIGNPRQNVGTNQQAYYFQDSWKMRSNLTLDFGLRYEYQPFDALNSLQYPAIDRTILASTPLLTRIEVKNDKNNFAPRLGFAYTPTFLKSIFGENKTVLRGGYGMFYDAFFTNISNNGAGTSPNAFGYSVTAGDDSTRGALNPLGLVNAATATPDPTASVNSVGPNFRNPMVHQWNFNVQRELPLGMKAEVAYVGTRGERLWLNEQINPKINGGARVVPTRGSILLRTNGGDSVYHGLQAQLSRNVGFIQLRGSYTWSKALDNQSEVFTTSGGTSIWQNYADPRGDRGLSVFDRTHRAAISYSLTPPTPWKKGVLGVLTDGWLTTGVVSFQSGTPDTIYLRGYDQNLDGSTTNDRPSLGNPAGTVLIGRSTDGGVTFKNYTGGVVGAVMPKDSFKYLVIRGTNGNVGRNSYRYPGSMGFDASVSKDFLMPYREGHKIQIRMDLFNAFNHPNLGVAGFNTNILSPTYLDLNNTRRGGRSVLLWAKYIF